MFQALCHVLKVWHGCGRPRSSTSFNWSLPWVPGKGQVKERSLHLSQRAGHYGAAAWAPRDWVGIHRRPMWSCSVFEREVFTQISLWGKDTLELCLLGISTIHADCFFWNAEPIVDGRNTFVGCMCKPVLGTSATLETWLKATSRSSLDLHILCIHQVWWNQWTWNGPPTWTHVNQESSGHIYIYM